jgi:hypothetical protein
MSTEHSPHVRETLREILATMRGRFLFLWAWSPLFRTTRVEDFVVKPENWGEVESLTKVGMKVVIRTVRTNLIF